MTVFIKTCQTFGSFVSQATEATYSTNHPQHSLATNFAALCRALDYDTLFSKSATSFFLRSRRHYLKPLTSQTQLQNCVSVSEPASIRGFSTGKQAADKILCHACQGAKLSGAPVSPTR
ncbi:hypothetical protein, partial [Pseudacidovorax intermedius]|uniref:hypothetical protein n=1 Tax=Pseudacidovorax intermedius TaxID=433924 RepID=UPI001B873A37